MPCLITEPPCWNKKKKLNNFAELSILYHWQNILPEFYFMKTNRFSYRRKGFLCMLSLFCSNSFETIWTNTQRSKLSWIRNLSISCRDNHMKLIHYFRKKYVIRFTFVWSHLIMFAIRRVIKNKTTVESEKDFLEVYAS